MAHLKTSPRSRRTRTCGACGVTINIGDQYRFWSIKRGGKGVRCMKPDCTPDRGQLTSAKYGVILTAIDAAEKELPQAASKEDIESILQDVYDEAEQVVSEYEDSIDVAPNLAESNGWGEIKDQIEDWKDGPLSDAKENIEEGVEEPECPRCEGNGAVQSEDGGELEDCPDCQGSGHVESEEGPLDGMREKAQEALNEFPF
jgi:hypothetical protein